MNFIEFTLHDETIILINLDLVTNIFTNSRGITCICFEGENVICVKETYEEVKTKIKNYET